MSEGVIVFETERLVLRELGVADARSMFELNADPDVLRYTGDPPFASLDEAQHFLATYDRYRRFGMGRWAVIDKGDGSFLGWCGLKKDPETGTVDLGYRFFKAHWGRGLATESARGSLDYGFEALGLETILAHAAVANAASVRVLDKLGMKRIGMTTIGEHEAILFSLDRAEFLRSRQGG